MSNVICLFDALETFFVLFFIDVENDCAATFILKTVMHFIFFDEYKDEYIIDFEIDFLIIILFYQTCLL